MKNFMKASTQQADHSCVGTVKNTSNTGAINDRRDMKITIQMQLLPKKVNSIKYKQVKNKPIFSGKKP